MAGPGNILIKVGAETGQAVAELSRVNSTLGDTMTTSEKMGAGLRKAALPAAAALATIGYAAIGAAKAAAEDAAAQEHLAGVLERVTGASEAQVAATEDWISGVSKATGVADDELRPALEKIVVATGDVAKSQKLLGAALDISAASGKSVDTVSVAIAKAYTGQTSALEKLVPGLSEAAKQSDDFNVIMGELAKTTGGAMAESADTAAGQYKILQVQVAELQEELGAALLPVIQAILPLLNRFATFASENTTAIKILVGVVAALSAGILVANAAMKVYEALMIAQKVATVAWTAAQWLLNAALSANPIGIVIVALTALGVALVIAYQKSETFRSIVHAALNAVERAAGELADVFVRVKNVAVAAFEWIVSHWKLALFAFGPIGAAVYLIVTNFDRLKAAASSAADVVASAWNVGRFAFDQIASLVRSVADAFSAITSAVWSAIGAVESLISALGRIRVPSIRLPDLNPFGIPAPPTGGMPTRAAPAAASSGGGGITVNVYGAIDPEGTARTILRVLETHERRQGRAP